MIDEEKTPCQGVSNDPTERDGLAPSPGLSINISEGTRVNESFTKGRDVPSGRLYGKVQTP